MKSPNQDDKKDYKKKIMMIIIIILIILLLISSCSCTANFWGKIGSNYTGEKHVDITDDNKEEEIILDEDLKFDINEIEMYLSDEHAKIPFHFQNIAPLEFSCVTSDANIATCYVENNYVVIKPKKVGQVSVTLQTIINGKKYQTKAKVKIKEANRYIALSTTKGTINLQSNNQLLVAYYLVLLDGKLNVSISNPKIADVQITNNHLIITGKKVGKTTITLEIIVNGIKYTASYTLTVIDEEINNQTKSDTYLKSLTTNKGDLGFQSNIFNYTISVVDDTDTITFYATLSSTSSTITYTYNGKNVDNLNDLPLTKDTNELVIKVTGKDNTTTTYTVTIKKEKNNNNNLKDIKVSNNLHLTEEFNRDCQTYHLKASYKDEKVTLTPVLENEKSTMKYQVNKKDVASLNDIVIGDEPIEVTITVISENNETKTYTVYITKSKVEIKFLKQNYDFNLKPYNNRFEIIYQVYLDGKLLSKEEEKVYLKITGDYSGKYEILNGYIVLLPNLNMKNKNIKLQISYGNYASDVTNVFFNLNPFYDYLYSYDYEVNLNNNNGKESVILENNLFIKTPTVKKTPYGARIYDEQNPDIYIDLYFNEDELSLESIKGSNSLALEFKAKKEGIFNVKFSSYVLGEKINEFDIKIKAITKYLLTLDANGGTFNEFTDQYRLFVNYNENFDLTNYLNGYKLLENCSYYSLIGFDLNKDVKTPTYNKNNKNIIINKDTTLYAIYDTELKTDEILETKNIYLTDVDLFVNENNEKIIYPGLNSKGSYILTLNNITDNDIEIISITLEEDTICKDNHCLNMGYIIKDNPNNHYYFGSSNINGYEILNRNINTIINNNHTKNVISMPIQLKSKEKGLELSLLWKWLDKDDELDTYIGNLAAIDENTRYTLTLSIQYKTSVCKGGG